MKAAVVPAVKSNWEVKEVPTPEPGANQVLIKIHASGMCYTDVHQSAGELPGRQVWLQVTRGAATLNGTPLGTGDGAAVSEQVQLKLAASDDAEVLLLDLP